MLITKLELQFDKMRHVEPSFIKRTMPGTEALARLEQDLIYHELIALHNLDEAQRNQLLKLQQKTFENEDEQKESAEQQKALLSQQPAREKEAPSNEKRNQHSERDTQKTLQRDTEEATITQDVGELSD